MAFPFFRVLVLKPLNCLLFARCGWVIAMAGQAICGTPISGNASNRIDMNAKIRNKTDRAEQVTASFLIL